MVWWSFSYWLIILGIGQGHYRGVDCFKIFKPTTQTDLTVTATGLDEKSIYFLSNLILMNESFLVNSYNNHPFVISKLGGRIMTAHNAPFLLGDNYEIQTTPNPSQILLFVFNADEIGGRIKLCDVEAFIKLQETNNLTRFKFVFVINYGKYYSFTEQERNEYENETITYVNSLLQSSRSDSVSIPFFFEGYFPRNFQQKVRFIPFREVLVKTLISLARFPTSQHSFHQRNSEF
jgi:hypothetical protein